MSNIGKAERITQNRVIALFQKELGYCYLGDWGGGRMKCLPMALEKQVNNWNRKLSSLQDSAWNCQYCVYI